MPKASKEKVMERIAYIISLLSEGGKRPIELKRELKVDYATVMRYLNYLRKKGVIEKIPYGKTNKIRFTPKFLELIK